ncbi:hypothetical protein NSERUTF1_1414 [Nocardia seriolae]|nr:hypothetical protein NSERUTF1_1414 [Nocardia seriolae]
MCAVSSRRKVRRLPWAPYLFRMSAHEPPRRTASYRTCQRLVFPPLPAQLIGNLNNYRPVIKDS